MKYAKLTNLSSARRAYSGLRDGSGRGLVLDAGETKPVHPSVVNDPRIKAAEEADVLKVELPGDAPAPVKRPAAPPKEETPEEPKTEPEETEPEETEPEETEPDEAAPADPALRELYVEAPGITEKNVDAVLEAFPSIQDLADAEEDALVAAGVSKSFAGRVLEWSIEQL